MRINGEVRPGFESVRELMQRSLSPVKDKNLQLCVYVGEERVVDLWVSSDNDGFSADSLVNVFSSGKSVESILMATLVDQELLILLILYLLTGRNLWVKAKIRLQSRM